MPDARDRKLLLLLAGVISLVFIDVLVGAAGFYQSDAFMYHFPLKRVVRDAMLGGEFPYWTNAIHNGIPLAANPAFELFYPPQWLVLLPDYLYGFQLHIVLHLYLAALGAYLLAREGGLSAAAATFGALSYSLGPFLVGCTHLLPTLFVWSLAPLVAWAVLRVLREATAARVAVAALVAATQLIVLEPAALAQSWALVAAAAFIATRARNARMLRSAALLALIVAAALAIAAVQLLPAIDHARDTVRAGGLSFESVREYAMPPMRAAEVLIPHLYGKTDYSSPQLWGSGKFDRGAPYINSIYAGTAIAVCALAALLMPIRGRLTAVALLLASYLLAIGDHTPLWRMLHATGMNAIRFPERFAISGVVTLIALAVVAFDRLVAGREDAWRAVAIAAGVVLLVNLMPAASALLPGHVDRFRSFWQPSTDVFALAAAARTTRLISFALALCGAALAWTARRGVSRAWILVGLFFVLLDLTTAGRDAAPRTTLRYFDPPAALAVLPPHAAVFNRGDYEDRARDFYDAAGLMRGWSSRNYLRPYSVAGWGARVVLSRDYDLTALTPTHGLAGLAGDLARSGNPQWSEPLAVLAGADCIIDWNDPLDALRTSRGDIETAPAVRVTRLAAQPVAYFASRTVTLRSKGEAIDFMRANPRPYATAIVPRPYAQQAPARVLSLRETANTIDAEVEAQGDALLVISRTAHKYWTATLDGSEVPLEPANFAFQAVPVPRGRHHVALRYANPLVKAGGAVSAAALLLLGGAALRERRRRA